MTVIIVHLAQTQTNLLALEWSVEFNISYEWEMNPDESKFK